MANTINAPVKLSEMQECNVDKGRTMPWSKGDALVFQGTHSVEQTNGNKWLAIQVSLNGIVKNLSAAQLVRVGNGIYEGGDATAFVNRCNQSGNGLVIKEVKKVSNSYGSFSSYLFFDKPKWLQPAQQTTQTPQF